MADGGDGDGDGGAGAGGRITVNYQEGSFQSDRTSAVGGTAGNNGEHGGPGVIYLYGKRPLNQNLRIDNKGKVAKVSRKQIVFTAKN